MTPSAPAHLRSATRAWWRKTAEIYLLEDHHLKLLTLAGEALDRATEAREALAAAGGPVRQGPLRAATRAPGRERRTR